MKTTLALTVVALILVVLVGAVTLSQTTALGPTAGASSPIETAQSFYDWYLDYVGDQPDGTFRNAMVDGAYRTNPDLTPEFVAQIDDLLASFKGQGGGYDPFLCAQDVPSEVLAQAATVNGDTATVTMSTSFEGHGFMVELRAVDGQWLITSVNCQPK